MQSLLFHKLANHYGRQNVTWELPTGNGTQVDLAINSAEKWIYYEIKTYPSVRVSIREAIGQLLEYYLWAQPSLPIDLVIVSHIALDENASKYLQRVRQTLGLQIEYQRFDPDRNYLHQGTFTNIWYG